MKRRKRPHSDKRLDYFCLYCGIETPNTDDHIPSKILLDEPLPDNLHKVRACFKCNNGFSLDEEYFACLIECTICGTTEIGKLNREKIRKVFEKKPQLQTQLERARTVVNNQIFFKAEEDRIRNVVLKLARGHAKLENSDPYLEEPIGLLIQPIHTMTSEEQKIFFSEPEFEKFPEVGSRACISLVESGFIKSPWIIVQPGNYKYLVSLDSGTIVKMVIWDYLAIQVIWE